MQSDDGTVSLGQNDSLALISVCTSKLICPKLTLYLDILFS